MDDKQPTKESQYLKGLMISESEEKDDSFDQETRKLQRVVREKIMRVFDEQEVLNMDLDSKHKRLDSWSKELKKWEALIERERQKFEEGTNKRESEESLKKFDGLERNLKQKRKLGTEQLEGDLEVLKHMGGDDDVAIQQNINKMNELLQEKKEELYDMEDLNQLLITKECQSNDELQEARKELIKGFERLRDSRVDIGIKRMGELDAKPFSSACKQRYSTVEAQIKAIELCSLWEEKLKDPIWHPFRVVEDCRGNAQYVLKEDDQLLVEIKEEWGDEVYDAVGTGLKEIEDYNPTGRYAVPELWNFKENRRATLKEAISFIFTQLKKLECKRT